MTKYGNQKSPLARMSNPEITNDNAISKLLTALYNGTTTFVKLLTTELIFSRLTTPATTPIDGQVWLNVNDLNYKLGGTIYTVLTVLNILSWIGNKIGISITLSSGKLDFEVLKDNSTIGINGSNQLYVKDDGITKTQINSDVAGLGIDQATDGSLEVSEGYYALTAPTTLTRDHKVLSFDTTSAAITQPLPLASTMLGHKFEIDFTTKGGANNLIFTRSGSDNIVDASTSSGTTFTLSNVGDYLVIQAIASGKWKMILPPSVYTIT